MVKCLSGYLMLLAFFFATTVQCFSQEVSISNNSNEKYIEFGNDKMHVTLDYNNKVNISRLVLNGQEVIKGSAGVLFCH